MSRESGQDRSQKTVAELLALHGGNPEGRRRHRRAADEEDEQGNGVEAPRRARDVTDTGPQAIIDRVRGDNPPAPPPAGRRRAKPDDAPPPPAGPRTNGVHPSGTFSRPNGTPPPESGAFPRPNGTPPPKSGAFPRPNGTPPPESGALPRPNGAPPPESGAFPHPNGAPDSAGFPRPNVAPPPESGAFPRPNVVPPPESGAFPRPAAPPPESGTFPRPNGVPEPGLPRRPRPQDSAPLRRPPQESGALPLPEQAPPGEAARPPGHPAEETRQVPPVRRTPPGALSARLDGLDAPAPEDTPDPGPPPPGGMASGAFPAPPRRRRRAPGRPQPEPEPHTEQFQAVEGQPPEAVVPPNAPPAGLSRWRRRRDQVSSEDTEVGVMPVVPDAPEHPSGFAPAPQVDEEHLEATGFHDPFAEDDEEVDEFGDFGEAEPERLGGYDYEAEPGQDDFDDEPQAEVSPAKQWLSMGVQLALGVLGGALVWLGFNWLWGQIPAAALVVALLVIVGLVWIVRKIRRADDIQTMVLAVLVGLVVTVSPAALLLLSR